MLSGCALLWGSSLYANTPSTIHITFYNHSNDQLLPTYFNEAKSGLHPKHPLLLGSYQLVQPKQKLAIAYSVEKNATMHHASINIHTDDEDKDYWVTYCTEKRYSQPHINIRHPRKSRFVLTCTAKHNDVTCVVRPKSMNSVGSE